MKTHIDALLNRKSEREFLKKEIEIEKIETIFDVINSSPTSSNSHDFSVIKIDDNKIRQKISLNIPSQKHIVDAPLFLLFCTDLNRIEHFFDQSCKQHHTNTLNNLITSTGDAFIAATFAHSAALNLGLGCCFVGIVRGSLNYLKQKLQLEGKMIPLVGLAIGYVNQTNDIKPKINKIYHNKYNKKDVQLEIQKYNQEIKKYYQSRNSNTKESDWFNSIMKMYEKRTDEIDEFISSNWKLK